MNTVVICPGCKKRNSGQVSFCARCRTPLTRGQRLTKESEGREIDGQFIGNQPKRGYRGYVLGGIAVFISIVSLLYYLLHINNYSVLPSSQIGAELAQNNWPMYQRSSFNEGFSETEPLAEKLTAHLIFESADPVVSSPAIVAGILYLTSGESGRYSIIAIDAYTGMFIWKRQFPAPISYSPAVAGHFVYLAVGDGRIFALSAHDGETQWSSDLGNHISSSPTIRNGIVYIGSFDEKLYALDAANGELLWEREVNGRVTSIPAVNDEIIAFVSQENLVHILDAVTGQMRLEYRTSMANGSVSMDGERLYVADWKGNLYSIDWTQEEALFEKKIRTIRINLFFWGFIKSFPPVKGAVWLFNRPGEHFIGTPVIANKSVYISSSTGKIFKVNQITGELIWEYDAGVLLTESMSATASELFIGDTKGAIHIISHDTGELNQKVDLAGPITSPPILANGMLYVAAGEGGIYLLR